jgi:putative Ca2+/H+ antiporter (TMEM165/GDT1 family)
MSRYIPFVILGTTLGMMLANAPAVRIGKALAGRIDMTKVRWLAATLFLLMGMGTLASGTTLADKFPWPGRDCGSVIYISPRIPPYLD